MKSCATGTAGTGVVRIHVRVRIDENSNDIRVPATTCSPKRGGPHSTRMEWGHRIYMRAGGEERDDICFIPT